MYTKEQVKNIVSALMGKALHHLPSIDFEIPIEVPFLSIPANQSI